MKKSILLKISLGFVIFVVCLFVTLTIYRIRSESLPVTATIFIAPKTESISWEQVFKRSAPIKMERFDTGSVLAKKSGVLNLKHPKAKGMPDELIEFKVFAYLIHHEKFGDYLVDAGLDASIQENPYGNVKGIFGKKIFYSQKKEMDVESRLKKRNIMPKGIFLTHLHYDHTSGLLRLPLSIQCYIGRNETYMNYKFIYENDCLKGFNNLNQFDFSKAQMMEPLGPALDIFGDGSLWAASTPGHTKGHISYLVNSKEGPILIIGDACIIKYGLESGIGPGTYSRDIKLAQTTLDKIIEFHRMYPQVKLAFGHE